MTDNCTRSAGFTLVEVVVAVTVVSMSVLGLGAVFIASQRAHEVAVEEAVVSHALRRAVSEVRGKEFAEIGTLYEDYGFTVPEVEGSGSITMYFDETRDVPQLGLPRDLDGDGLAKSTDVSASYVLIPIRVTVNWSSTDGQRTQSLYTYLSEDNN